MKKIILIPLFAILFAGCLKQLQPYPQEERLLISIPAPSDETDHPKLAGAIALVPDRVTSVLVRSQRYRVLEQGPRTSESDPLKPEDPQKAKALSPDAVLKIKVIRLVFSEKKTAGDGVMMESVCALEGRIISVQSGEVILSAIGEGTAQLRSSDPSSGGKANIPDRKSLMTDSISIAAEDLAGQLARNAVRKAQK